MNKNKLKIFEEKIKKLYLKKKIKAPIHLSGNNEEKLIKIFRKIRKDDYVFSTWRSHYHALLHGINEKKLERKILNGKSMTICNSKPFIFSSAIVGGTLPIATGVAYSLKKTKKKVWCFIGDMTAETGMFYECLKFSKNFNLPITFIVEDNGLSTNTPTKIAWGMKNINKKNQNKVLKYKYKRIWPHHGVGQWILF